MAESILVLYKRQGMSLDEFRSYREDTHGPVAAIPGAV